MNNATVAAKLEEIADLLEFQGANPFRTRAYRNGARAIRDLSEPVQAVLDDPQRQLSDISGIGKDLAEKIEVLATTGELPMLNELHEQVPPSVLPILRIPGLGPKKASALFNEMGIRSIDQLRIACESGEVRHLKGFGKKTEETILSGLELAETSGMRIFWQQADAIVQELLSHMRPLASINRMEVAGSYRRGKETVGDLDLLVEATEHAEVMDHFGNFAAVKEVIARGETKMSVRLDSGLQIDLRVVPERSFGAALQYFTGSKDHNVVLRGLAKKRNLKINEWGVFRVEKEKETYVAGRTEEEVYAQLDLPCFPPELREARQEFVWAESGKLPELVELGDIRGDLHMHTTASDGRATIEEMATAAKKRGLKYIAITDHSKRVSMAHGLDGDRLRRQWEEIDRLNERIQGIVVLKGVECDILEKGGMDLEDEVLAEADWVIASIHYGQNQPAEQITRRMTEALEHPHVSAIAHPTGRLINSRKPYDVDLDAVFETAAKHHKLLELNANPARLDLDDVHCAAARRHGIHIVISSDAHSAEGLGVMRYGILQARRAGLTKGDVANSRTWKQLQKLLGK